ncbi:MAG: hypothetical protein K6T65_17045 [Peptococcaceae bacterium]|nr:hypothetical protein [Peptococcaceae bacterium]
MPVKMSSKFTSPAVSGFHPDIPIRPAAPNQPPWRNTRPVVDIKGLVAQAVNETIDHLAAWQKAEAEKKKSFFRKANPRPEINLADVIESLGMAILEQYRVSAAQLIPPVLELAPEHMDEVAGLQGQAVELFCREVLRVVKGDLELEKQVYTLCPALAPPPEPDYRILKGLQQDFDKSLKDVEEAFHRLSISLAALDELAESEIKILTKTPMTTSRRLWMQAQVVRVQVARRLEARDTSGKPFELKAARW